MNPSADMVLSSCDALTDRMAAGGMAELWAATAPVLGRTDALTAKLTGFSISALVNTAAQTPPDQIFATSPHLWPEQVTGQSATAPRDIYALGALGDEMLIRQLPFSTDSLLATAVPQLNMTPPRPEPVPLGVHNAIGAAAASDPAKGSAAAANTARGPDMADAIVVSGARVASPVAALSLAVTPGARTPGVTARTAAPASQNRARQATTTGIASPSEDSRMPGQPTMSLAAAWDHHQKKDGKQ